MDSVLANGVDLGISLDQNLVWAQATDTVVLSDENQNATRGLVAEISCVVPIFKKAYVDLVQQLAEEVNDGHQSSEVYRRELAERDGKIEELSLRYGS